MASFWDTLGPGLINTGGNYLLQGMASKEAEDRLKQVESQGSQIFQQQQALMAPGYQAEQQALMRELQAKGMLGAASFSPVAGTINTTGQPMNPHMAALLAAQAGAKSRAAYDSIREGEGYKDRALRRRQGIPSKPSFAEMLLRGGMNVLKDKSARDTIFKGVGGMFGGAMDWLRGSPEVFEMPAFPDFTPDEFGFIPGLDY